MPRIILEGYHCNRCGHNWVPRNGTGYRDKEDPTYCQRCRSPYWNKPRRLSAYEQRQNVEVGQPHIDVEGYSVRAMRIQVVYPRRHRPVGRRGPQDLPQVQKRTLEPSQKNQGLRRPAHSAPGTRRSQLQPRWPSGSLTPEPPGKALGGLP